MSSRFFVSLRDRLKRPKLPRWFESKPNNLTEKLRTQTVKEIARSEELRKVLGAKRELAKAKAESIRLTKEINGVNEMTVDKVDEPVPVKPTRSSNRR